MVLKGFVNVWSFLRTFQLQMIAKFILTNSQAFYFHQGSIAEVKYVSHTLLQLHIRSSYNKRQANNGETFRFRVFYYELR